MDGLATMEGLATTATSAAPAAARTLELRKGEIAPKTLARLEEIGRGFEAVFANTLLSQLLAPLQGDGLAGSGPGASVVQGMLEQNLADTLAKGRGLGIGRMVVQSMKPLLATQRVSPQELAALAAQKSVPPQATQGEKP